MLRFFGRNQAHCFPLSFLFPHLILLGLGTSTLLSCRDSSSPNSSRNPGACPTPDRPYLHLELPSCQNLIPPPRLTQVTITPPGGKVPLEVEFRAVVEVPFPELRAGLKLRWDLDGKPGFDLTAPVDGAVRFHYENCTNITVTARAEDAIGHLSNELQRTLILRCKAPPRILSFYAQGPLGPPTGLAGTTIHFFMQAEDLDNEDPALIPSRGIARYLLDADGDGVFDGESGGLFADLGFDYTYTRIGNYFPVLRVEDGDGLATDSQTPGNLFPVLVQIFASFLLLGGDALGGSALSFAPLLLNGGEALLLALANTGYGYARKAQGFPAFRWTTRGVANQPSLNVQDLLVLDHLAPALEPAQGLMFYALSGTDPAITPESPLPFTCPSQGGIFAGSLWKKLLYAPGPPPLLGILAGSSGGITAGVFFDPSTWNTSTVDPGTFCNNLSPLLSFSFDPAKIYGSDPQGVARDLALLYPWLFVVVQGSQGTTVATYSLTSTDIANGTPVCAVTSSGCLYLPGENLQAITVTPSFSSLSLSLGYAVFVNDHYELALTTFLQPDPVTLYANGSSYPESSTTFQRLDPTRLRFETGFFNTLPANSPVTLAGRSLPLLLLGGGTTLRIYELSGSPPVFTPLTLTTNLPFQVNELLEKEGVVLAGDRSTPYIPFSLNPNLNPWERQKKGVYALPITSLGSWVRLLPRNTNFAYLDSYPGPTRLKPALSSGKAYVLNAGVRMEGYRLDPYEIFRIHQNNPSDPRTSSLFLPGDSLVLSDFATVLELDPLTEQGFVATGDQGFVAFSGGGTPKWRFSQDLGGIPMGKLHSLPGNGTRPTLFSGIASGGGWLWLTDATLVRSFGTTGETYLDLPLAPSQSLDTNGKALLGVRVVTGSTEELRFYPLAASGDLAEPVPRMVLPRDLPALGDLATQGEFAFGELDNLFKLRLPHRYLWFSSGTIACIDPVWRQNCPSGESLFTNGPRGGILLRVTVRGEPYLLRLDTATGLLDLYTTSGDLLTQNPFSVCAQVPVNEQRLCATTFSLRDLKSVDPYLLLVTAGGIFVLDLFKPASPKLAVWIKGGEVYGVAGVLLGDRMRIYYSEGGTAIRALEVQGLFQ